MSEPRAKTPEEARADFLNQLAGIAVFWAGVKDQTPLEICNGVVFSVLVTLDGGGMEMPAMDLVLAPHESDKDYRIEEGENWFEPGQVINDVSLHDLWHKHEVKKLAKKAG